MILIIYWGVLAPLIINSIGMSKFLDDLPRDLGVHFAPWFYM